MAAASCLATESLSTLPRVPSGSAAGSASTAEKTTEETNVLAEAKTASTEAKPASTEPKKKSLDFDDLPLDNTPALSRTWSVGVNASAGLLAANTSGGAKGYDMTGFSKETDTFANWGNVKKETEYTPKHRLPLSIGLSLHYPLTPRLTLNSGVTYTYLYSEFTNQQPPHTTYDQKLHYLGVPLGVSYKLWSANHFQLYFSAGMMLAKCLNDKPWQLSVDGALGAEFFFTETTPLNPHSPYSSSKASADHFVKAFP